MEKEKSTATPTGCYKCGLPGHWSRDCPSSAPDSDLNTNPNPNPKTPYNRNSYNSSFKSSSSSSYTKPVAVEKPKKVPRTRPKLTPELLLSDDGLGFVLKHFPRNFKYHGRGHEVNDLGNLIRMYSEWNTHLIPCYSFDQFVHKVEQVSTTARVKRCIRDLRDRVSNGDDPTKLHEPPAEEYNVPNDLQDHSATPVESISPETQGNHVVFSSQAHAASGTEEEMLLDLYEKTAEDQHQDFNNANVAIDRASDETAEKEVESQVQKSSCSKEDEISADQKDRMEANRLRALERAAARKRPLEAN